MTRLHRGLVGVSIGALLTLCLHPASRGILFTGLKPLSQAAVSRIVDINSRTLPQPDNVTTAGAWIEEGCERLRAEKKLTRPELLTLKQISQEGSKREPENAFWFQMQAIFFDQLEEHGEALNAWFMAAKCNVYNDHQSARLMEVQEELSRAQGNRESWQYAFLYAQRSEAPSILVEQYARSVISTADYDTKQGLRLRYATIINADLMRSGARWMPIARRASDLLELCTYPPDMSRVTSPMRLQLGKIKILDLLRKSGMDLEYTRAAKSFVENEAWQALLFRPDVDETIKISTLKSVATNSIPTASLVTCLLASICLVPLLYFKNFGSSDRFSPYVTTAIGIVGGTLMFFIAGSWLSALSFAASIAFLMASPIHRRSHPPTDIGPLYRLATFLLSLLLGTLTILFVVSNISATRLAFPTAGIQYDLETIRTAIGGQIGLVSSIFLVCSPLWAFVVRVSTPHMVRLSLLRLTSYVAAASLLGTIVSTVISVAAEKELTSNWHDIVANEPNYHLYK